MYATFQGVDRMAVPESFEGSHLYPPEGVSWA